MGRTVIPGVNDLATVAPELAAEALFDATTVSASSGRKLGWRCKEGHEWEAAVYGRRNGNGCPFCAGKRPVAGVTDLATTHPQLAREACFDATKVTAGSEKRVEWTCPNGHSYEATVISRTRGTRCPVCSGRRVVPGINDLATLRPDLAAEALFDPTTVTLGSGKKLRWRCSHGHEYATIVASRTTKGVGCSYCANQAVLPGFNDLETVRPDLAAEALFDATTVVPGSAKALWWRCPNGHEYQAQPVRRLKGDGCTVCSGRKVIPGVNDLSTTHPEIALQAVTEEGYDPCKVTKGHGKRFKWRCSQGHEWFRSPNSRTSQNSGCPVCAGSRVEPGYNDLATTDPELAAEALFDTTTVSRGSSRKRAWRCSLGHKWFATPVSRVSLSAGCPYCSGRSVWPGFNDLATTHPALASQMAADKGYDPTTYNAGSGRKALWRCEQGHEWMAVVGSRSAGVGCPSCSSIGFDPTKSAWLYLMRHDSWAMLQVGITNDPEARLTSHVRNGWEAMDIRGPMRGVLAQQWERAILRTLHQRGAELAPSGARHEPLRSSEGRRLVGEAWWWDDINVTSIRDLVRMVEEDEARAVGTKKA